MATTWIHLDSLGSAWRGLRHKLVLNGGSQGCVHLRRPWLPLRFQLPAISMNGRRYCLGKCLEPALSEALRRIIPARKASVSSHRVPLGLSLISRRQLSARQLQIALSAQSEAGYGRIGEWLQALGFVSEQQVTAALARQWSCPVLPSSATLHPPRSIQIPMSLLESLIVVPVAHVEATNTLHVAFAERMDYAALYAFEQMLGCHTEACLAAPGFVRAHLDIISRRRLETEAVFESLADRSDFARIIRSYCTRLAAFEVRIVPCGPHLWVRLFRRPAPPMDLVLLSPEKMTAPTALSPPSGFFRHQPIKSFGSSPMD